MRPLAPSLSYPLACIVAGLIVGWTPMLFHGPIPEKWDYYYINGSILVWAYYAARLTIGFWVGVTTVPGRWYLRGPLCGALAMFPLGFVALANPLCGSV